MTPVSRSRLRRAKPPHGASLVEYGLLAGLVSVVAIVSVTSLGKEVDRTFSSAATAVALGGGGEGAGGGGAPTAPGNGAGEPLEAAEPLSLINPSFEDGSGTSIDGWTSDNGAFRIATGAEHSDNASAANTGLQMVYPGTAPSDVLRQAVDVSDYAASIDAGSVAIRGSIWAITDAEDGGELMLSFLDAGGSQIGPAATTGLFVDDNRSFMEKTVLDAVPAGTRSVEIALGATLGGAGSVLQTYYDDASLEFVPLSSVVIGNVAIPIANAGFESGSGTSIPGWTSANGDFQIDDGSVISDDVTSAYAGSQMVVPGVSPGDTLTQALDLSDFASQIAGGAVVGRLSTQLRTEQFDRARLHITYLDGAAAELSSGISPWLNTGDAWSRESYALAIPAGAESAVITLEGELVAPGSSLQTYFDEVAFTISH